MILNLNKRGKMKVKILLSSLLFVFGSFSYANEESPKGIEKLDVLDKQSQEFFNSVIGLDKEYLEKQINIAKEEKTPDNSGLNIPAKKYDKDSTLTLPTIVQKSKEEIAKEIFMNQSELGRLGDEILRAKKLQDIKIKSMYSFNGRKYVVLKSKLNSNTANNDELSSQIEGRYRRGDTILGYTISSVDIRTKSLKLYKQVDDKFAYYVYLNNYGVTVSDLKKREKQKPIRKKVIKHIDSPKVEKKAKNKVNEDTTNKVKNAFLNIESKPSDTSCYILNVGKANVRKNADANARILRVLRKGDKFSIVQKDGIWAQIDTIYKKKSGDVMDVKDEHNWIKIIKQNFEFRDCK